MCVLGGWGLALAALFIQHQFTAVISRCFTFQGKDPRLWGWASHAENIHQSIPVRCAAVLYHHLFEEGPGFTFWLDMDSETMKRTIWMCVEHVCWKRSPPQPYVCVCRACSFPCPTSRPCGSSSWQSSWLLPSFSCPHRRTNSTWPLLCGVRTCCVSCSSPAVSYWCTPDCYQNVVFVFDLFSWIKLVFKDWPLQSFDSYCLSSNVFLYNED